MKPVVKAIDILQSEKNVYMGWLLPTLYELQSKMEKVRRSTHYCKALASAIIDGINERFGEMMKDRELIASSILVPKFKNHWTAEEEVLEDG